MISRTLPAARLVGSATFGRACRVVRALCQQMTSRPRALAKTNCDRFSRERSSTRSMAAPRRTHERMATRSTMSGSAGHSARWQ
jgi:hypothetical protein